MPDREHTTFTAPWDRTLKTTTPLVCLLMVVVLTLTPFSPALWTVKGLVVVIVFTTWLWAPRRYRIENGILIVERLAGSVRIPLAGLRAVRSLLREELRGAVRSFGVGGCFGYYGRFSRNLENQTWFVTDRDRCVRLDSPAGVYLVSPGDPVAFVSIARRYVSRPDSAASAGS